MATLEDQVIALQADVTEIKTAVAAITTPSPAPAVDLSAVESKLDAIIAQFAKTPVAAPVEAPAESAPTTAA